MARITRNPVQSEDTNEETEATPSEPGNTFGPSAVKSGWGARTVRQELPETVKAPYVDLTDCEPHLLKILDEEPPVLYGQHFPSSGRPLTCSQVRDDETDEIIKQCPMCKRGHKRSEKMMVNAVDMSDPTTLRTFSFGPEIGDALQDFTKGPRDDTGKPSYIPINDANRYWEIKRTNGKRVSYKTRPIKARDLSEDYDVLPLTEDVVDTFSEKLFGENTVWRNTDKQLQDAADRLTDAELTK